MSSGSTKLREVAVGMRRVVPRGRREKARPPHWSLAVLRTPTLRLVRAYPAKAAAVALVGLLMTGIVGNAMWFQRGHHPAPLFAGSPQAAPPDDAAPGPVPLPIPRPPDKTASPEPVVPAPAVEPPAVPPPIAPTPVLVAPKPAPPVPAKHKTDGIAALLGGQPAPTPAMTKASDAAVLKAQRALVKLGYSVKPDGHMGADTRKALEKFAAGRHLDAMAGPLDPKILHDLAVVAGKPRA